MRPSLSRATGRSQAEWMSGCLCITLQGVMTLVPIDPFASLTQLSPISMCSDHLWWLITLKEVLYKQHLWFIFVYGKKTRTCSTHPASTHVCWEQTRAGDSKQSILHSEWRQQKTTMVAECEVQTSCSNAVTSTTLPCPPNMNGRCKQHMWTARFSVYSGAQPFLQLPCLLYHYMEIVCESFKTQ